MFDANIDIYLLYTIFIFIFIISGVVKGITGIGLPLTSIALLTFFISPLQAIGLNMIPVIIANLQQFLLENTQLNKAEKYKLFAVFLMIGMIIHALQAASL